MRFSIAAAILPFLAAVSATKINVHVGGENTLTFHPNSVNATKGYVITFHFMSKNHTVTQSTFSNPCTAVANGTNSGFIPVASNATTFPTFNFTVTNSTAPLFFYCAQRGHCSNGMVFAINPTAEHSFAAFQAKANASASGASSVAPTSSTTAVSTRSSASTSSAASASAGSSSSGATTVKVGGTAIGAFAAAAVAVALAL